MELWEHVTSSRDVQYDKKYYSESNYWTICIHCMIQNITVHVSNRMLWTPDAELMITPPPTRMRKSWKSSLFWRVGTSMLNHVITYKSR